MSLAALFRRNFAGRVLELVDRQHHQREHHDGARVNEPDGQRLHRPAPPNSGRLDGYRIHDTGRIVQIPRSARDISVTHSKAAPIRSEARRVHDAVATSMSLEFKL